MVLSIERKSELALAMFRWSFNEEIRSLGPITDDAAKKMVSQIAMFCKDMNISYDEGFEFFRTFFSGDSLLAFNRAVNRFGEPVPDLAKKPMDILSQNLH